MNEAFIDDKIAKHIFRQFNRFMHTETGKELIYEMYSCMEKDFDKRSFAKPLTKSQAQSTKAYICECMGRATSNGFIFGWVYGQQALNNAFLEVTGNRYSTTEDDEQ